MPIDWKGLLSIAAATPIGRKIIGATLIELETNPTYQRFVEQYQNMNVKAAAGGGVAKAECMICMFCKYGREQQLTTLTEAPRHRCSDHGGAWFP